jgi:type VI secretion system protein ImpK
MAGRRHPPARGARAPAAKERRGILETLALEPGVRRAPAPRRRLVDLCAEWLGLIVALRGVSSLPDPAGLRARVVDLKSRLEQTARDAGFSAADVEASVFALVTFLDETVLNAPGPARDVWIARPLQLELYGQMVGGEEFYERLEVLRRDRESRIEALEVYYTCLALGFAGKHRLSGPERIQAILAEVERDIAGVRRGGRGVLAPHASRHDELADVVAEGVPWWLSVAIFVPATLLAFVVVKLLSHAGAIGSARSISRLLEH